MLWDQKSLNITLLSVMLTRHVPRGKEAKAEASVRYLQAGVLIQKHGAARKEGGGVWTRCQTMHITMTQEKGGFRVSVR